jgi:hemolysin activation/secretion protein
MHKTGSGAREDRARLFLVIAAAGVCAAVLSPAAFGQSSSPPVVAQTAETAEFSVTRFDVQYEGETSGLPAVEELMGEAMVSLEAGAGGYVAGDPAAAGESVGALNESLRGSGGARFSRRALEAVNRAIVRALNARGFIGVLVATNPDDLAIEVREAGVELASAANMWTDRRPGGTGPMRIAVYTARVVKVRTVAAGERVPVDEVVDHPLHARIREGSPIIPAAEGAEPGGDVLRKDTLDEYTYRLNRHPGRRVDVAISTAEAPGSVVLDYLVRENRPWFVYAQIANDGTRATEEIRERFGFIHNQLTGNDDQLSVDYVTAGFSEVHAVSGSYEFPIGPDLRTFRVRPFGGYSAFDASQVGFADEDFEGESWNAGVEAAWNFFQRRDLFLDLVGGIRWENVRVNNKAVAVSGSDAFLLPSLGVRLERFTDEMATTAFVRGEFNLDDFAGTGDPSLSTLGRTDPDEDFGILQFGADHSFFLEPLVDRKSFDAGTSTLAHEIALRFKGQHSLGSRLAPTFQDVVGGRETVRGYPESAVAGDHVYVGSVEYRLHIPRLLEPYDERGENPPSAFGQVFRLRPQTRYGRPDWDLITKAFIDFGRAEQEDRLSFETNETLIGAGVGVELLVGRNINMRLDWGVALEEVEQPTRVTPGSSRVHFVVTLVF